MIYRIATYLTIFTLSIGLAFGAVPTISPEGHQAIKAKILNPDPKNFTINVRYLANLGADENAGTFALYTARSLPSQCGDFSDLKLSYDKPEKYKRHFDLSSHEEVITAINEYQCVIVKNIPTNN